jgi:hypothetical protein
MREFRIHGDVNTRKSRGIVECRDKMTKTKKGVERRPQKVRENVKDARLRERRGGCGRGGANERSSAEGTTEFARNREFFFLGWLLAHRTFRRELTRDGNAAAIYRFFSEIVLVKCFPFLLFIAILHREYSRSKHRVSCFEK